MPFKSKRQMRAAFGDHIPGISKEKAREWAHETKSLKGLPDRAPAKKGKPTLRAKKAYALAPYLRDDEQAQAPELVHAYRDSLRHARDAREKEAQLAHAHDHGSGLDPAAIHRGMKIELEHTKSPTTATQIAIDHLRERPDYYELLAKHVESEKDAGVLAQAARLGATDFEDLPGVRNYIKSTPRLFMRHRSPEELAGIEHGINAAFNRVEQPVVDASHKAISKVPGVASRPRLQKGLNTTAEAMIRNPDFMLAKLSPIPGSSFAVLGLKKGIEKTIDRLAPPAISAEEWAARQAK